MAEKRIINAKQLMEDIRSGMPATDLMEKWGFSAVTLRKAFRKLIDFNVVSKSELSALTNLHDDSNEKSIRQTTRKQVPLNLKIFENDNPFNPGMVKDISEKGICVEGIDATVADEKCFIIRAGGFSDPITVVFDAKCRWVNNENRKPLAGFEITSISVLDSKQLQTLVDEC